MYLTVGILIHVLCFWIMLAQGFYGFTCVEYMKAADKAYEPDAVNYINF
jgi:hypothetical protein